MKCRYGAIAGTCTSGSGMDCNLRKVKVKGDDGKMKVKEIKGTGDGSAFFCNTSMKVNTKRGHCHYRTQRSDHTSPRCRKGRVIVGMASSGGRPHVRARGQKMYGLIKCCDAVSGPHITYYGDK